MRADDDLLVSDGSDIKECESSEECGFCEEEEVGNSDTDEGNSATEERSSDAEEEGEVGKSDTVDEFLFDNSLCNCILFSSLNLRSRYRSLSFSSLHVFRGYLLNSVSGLRDMSKLIVSEFRPTVFMLGVLLSI